MPAKKRPDNRQGRGTPDLKLADAPAEVPPPPKAGGRKLLKCTTESWSAFWSSELASLVTPADRPAIDRLWSMYDLRERMNRAAIQQPFAEGSTGQVVAHPAMKEMASLDGRIVALEDRFGITPKGRLALGITMGAAAKSLDEMNRRFMGDDEGDDDDIDPRLANVIDIESTG